MCSKELYVCTRCAGKWIGFATVVGWSAFVSSIVLSAPQAVLAFLGLPLAGAVDWLTQTLGYRESNNLVRVVTGFLYGAGVGLYFAAAFNRLWTMVIAGTGVFLFYFAVLVLLLRWSGIASTYLAPYEEFIRQFQKGEITQES